MESNRRSKNKAQTKQREGERESTETFSLNITSTVRPLLVLDISGVLCLKHKKYINSNSSNLQLIRINKYWIQLRPGLKEFLDFCYNNYDIGFLSSTPNHNGEEMIRHILSYNQIRDTIFFWYRDHTYIDREFPNSYETLKRIGDVLDNPIINRNNNYHWNNTIICDDTFTKVRFNPPENVVLVKPFDGDLQDIELQDLIVKLPQMFANLAQRNKK